MRQAAADWNSGDHAPEYPANAGLKTSTQARPATETPNEARQAVTGHNASVVLVVSTVAAILAFAVIYIAFWA